MITETANISSLMVLLLWLILTWCPFRSQNRIHFLELAVHFKTFTQREMTTCVSYLSLNSPLEYMCGIFGEDEKGPSYCSFLRWKSSTPPLLVARLPSGNGYSSWVKNQENRAQLPFLVFTWLRQTSYLSNLKRELWGGTWLPSPSTPASPFQPWSFVYLIQGRPVSLLAKQRCLLRLSSLSYHLEFCWPQKLWFPISPILLSYLFAFRVEKAKAPHSSPLAWKIPWTEEPGAMQSTGSLRVRHDWATSLSFFTFMQWRRKWQPTPVFLPGESQGLGSLMGCRLRGSHRVGHDWSDLVVAGWC